MKKLLVLLAVFIAGSSSATATSNMEAAKRFIAALTSGDMTVAEPMVGDTIIFEDPTFNGDAPITDRDTVLRIYRNYTGGVRHSHPVVIDAFESHNTVVLTYMWYGEANLAPRDAPEKYVPLMAKIVRILEFKDGKVVRHSDLADYGVLFKAQAKANNTDYVKPKSYTAVAEKFISALDYGDMAFAGPLVGEHIQFEDPTAGAVHHKGRDKVMKMYQTYSGNLRNINRTLLSSFESSGTVVLNYVLYGETPVKMEDNTEQYVPVMGRVIRVVSFKDGRVVRHTDLADYNAMRKSAAEAKARIAG